MVKSDKCMADSQLLGGRARAAPLSLRLCLLNYGISLFGIERLLWDSSIKMVCHHVHKLLKNKPNIKPFDPGERY